MMRIPPKEPDVVPSVTPRLGALSIRHQPWSAPLTRPELGRGARLALTNRYVESDGVPTIPVTGEMHFSRVPREQWDERLRLMRAGGVTAVATYVIWLHHQPASGIAPDFTGNLDAAQFVRTAADAGLDVVLRIGPWVHGEARNGGFPDWVQAAPVAHRTDDPGYLALVDAWFAALGAELAPLCAPGGPVVAVQLDNELYDQPQHLVTLKHLARKHGVTAPIWTATAWGGAALPDGEVLPLYGGYGDGFWVDADRPWDPTFREHFFFSHVWDDPGIGADLRPDVGIRPPEPADRLPSPAFPAATCELGGGMATAYHRRPLLSGRDIAAVAHNKLGSGSGWQGYYMYAGGTNPAPGLNESHDCGYPNDLPEFDYDFHAPIGAAGRLGPAHAPLRRQHAFLDAFGSSLATMPSTLPAVRPTDVDDDSTLRWAMRSDGESGWVFVTWQQPHVPLPDLPDVRFEIELDDRTVMFPQTPITVPAGTIAHWPIGLEIAGVRIDWLTASPLTVLDGARPTLVALAEAGIPVELADAVGIRIIDAAEPCTLTLGGSLDLLVLPADLSDRLWVLTASGSRRLILAADEKDAVFEAAGRIAVRAEHPPQLREYRDGEFVPVVLHAETDALAGTTTLHPSAPLRSVESVPHGFGSRDGRASAPTAADIERYGTAWSIAVPARCGSRRFLEIDWAGDVARLEIDGTVVADRFWDGTTWTVGLDDLGICDRQGSTWLTLWIVPLAAASAVHLPADAAARRSPDAPLLALDAVRLVEAPLWLES